MGNGFFGGLFDFDGDGELNSFEQAMDFQAFAETMDAKRKEEAFTTMPDYQEEELENAGLDLIDLEYADESERREMIEDAGLDPDDYDFV